MTTTPQKKLTKPIPELRQELLVDKDTLRIAKALKMKIEDYVELVLDYVQNPEKEPELYLATDEELREVGHEPEDTENVARQLARAFEESHQEYLRNADVAEVGAAKADHGKKLSGEPAHSEPIKSKNDLFGSQD